MTPSARPIATWLDTDGLLVHLLGRTLSNVEDRRRASALYAELVAQVSGSRLWDTDLRQQIYLGDEPFADRMRARAQTASMATRGMPRAQREPPVSQTLAHWLAHHDSREQAVYEAYKSGDMTMTSIACELGLSISRVSRLIAKVEAKGKT